MFSHHNPSHSAHPLRVPRLLSLVLLFAFGIAGMGVGINALVKFNDQKRQLKSAAPAGATVNIDTNDVLDSGYVITVVCGLLALFSVIFALPALSARVGLIRLQALIFGFLSVWLFATLVAFTDFFANRSAKVSASIGSLAIPDSIIQSIVHSLGASTEYKHVDYCESSCHRFLVLHSCSPFALRSSPFRRPSRHRHLVFEIV